MSERYIIFPKCAWCNKRNQEVLYSFEWATDFKCEYCGKENDIEIEFKIYKKEKKKNEKTRIKNKYE